MRSVYLTALSPVKGADGDLKKYQISCTSRYGWHSPLPLMVPLNLLPVSFPRDRVDRSSLRSLPHLELTGPVMEEDHIILKMKDPMAFRSMYREINGKTVPPDLKDSFINWKGLLLHPAASGADIPPAADEQLSFSFRSWQIGIYKITYNETRAWWEDLNICCLWKVRKPA